MKIVSMLALGLVAAAMPIASARDAVAQNAAGRGSQATAAPTEEQMFSTEWRQQKIRDREANLQALDEEQRRFDKWERSAKRAVGGVCATCLGNGGGEGAVTVPSDAIANFSSGYEGRGFDETSAFYTVPPAGQPVAAPQVVSAPQAAARPLPPSLPAQAGKPLDIRPPQAR